MCLSLVSCNYFVFWKEEMEVIEEMDMKHVGFIGEDRIVIDHKGEYYTYRHIMDNGNGVYKFLVHVSEREPAYNVYSHRPTPAPALTKLINE